MNEIRRTARRSVRAASALVLATLAVGAPAQASFDIAYEQGTSVFTADSNGLNGSLFLTSWDAYGSTASYRTPQVSNDGRYLVSTSECSGGSFCSFVAVAPTNNPSLNHDVAYNSSAQFRDARWKPMSDRVVYSISDPGLPNGYDIRTTRVQISNGDDGYPVGTPHAGPEPDETFWRTLVNWRGNQRHPNFSGDGSKLVFSSNTNAAGTPYSDGQARVFIANADGTGAREVGVGTDPAISPNGVTIAFQRPPKNGSPTQIYSVSSAGGTPVRLTSNRATDSQPEWTTDGNKIIFTRCNGPCDVYTMTATGASQARLIAGAQGAAARQARIGTDYDVLLEKYVPQLRYDSQEEYFADSAATMTDNVSDSGEANALRRTDGTAVAVAGAAVGTPLTLGFLNWPSYSTGQPAFATDKIDAANSYSADGQRMHANYSYANRIYSRVAQDGAGKKWLQYWFFYYYNPYDVGCCGIGVHEGDWEMIQVGLDPAGAPDVATFAQHKDDDAEKCTWEEIEKWRSPDGDVPVVYVSQGSHASYTTPGEHDLWWAGLVQDHADGNGPRVRPRTTSVTATTPAWMKWQGQWGGSDSSPQGPVFQGPKWTAPDQFHAQAGACETPPITWPRRNSSDDAQPRPAAPVISARAKGHSAVVRYRFPDGLGGRARPRRIRVTVHPKSARFAPSGRTVAVRSGSGSVRVRLPLGRGRFFVRASALAQDGSRSAVVRARLR